MVTNTFSCWLGFGTRLQISRDIINWIPISTYVRPCLRNPHSSEITNTLHNCPVNLTRNDDGTPMYLLLRNVLTWCADTQKIFLKCLLFYSVSLRICVIQLQYLSLNGSMYAPLDVKAVTYALISFIRTNQIRFILNLLQHKIAFMRNDSLLHCSRFQLVGFSESGNLELKHFKCLRLYTMGTAMDIETTPPFTVVRAWPYHTPN